DERKNLGRDPGRQRTKNRGDEENCKAVANRLRKIRRAPAERTPLIHRRVRATRRSNASFETKHRPLVAFPGLLSFTQRRATNSILRAKSAKPSNCYRPSAATGMQATSALGRLLQSLSIGREVGSRLYRRAQTRSCLALASSSGSTQRFHVRSALGRWSLCSGLQKLLLRPLPLSLQ